MSNKHNAEYLQILKTLIGDEKFKQVVLFLGGEHIYISTSEEVNREERNKAMRKLYDSNIPIAEIASRYNLSESRTRRIINDLAKRK